MNLKFINGLDGRGECCVHALDENRKYVATFYGKTLADPSGLRDVVIGCLELLGLQGQLNPMVEKPLGGETS